MDAALDNWTNACVDGRIIDPTDGWIDEWLVGWMVTKIFRWIDNGLLENKLERFLVGWMHVECLDAWID